MSRDKPFPTLLPMPPSAQPRPFWSVVIPTYQRCELLKSCIESIMCQAVGEEHLEILVSDNDPASDIAVRVAEWTAGRALYTRNPQNVGTFPNINAAISRTRGKWIHIIPDDDWIGPGFYAAMEGAITTATQQIGVAVSHHVNYREDNKVFQPTTPLADGPGILGTSFLARLAALNPIQIPAVVMRRETFETSGLFREDLLYTGDWEFWFRAASKVAWLYVPNAVAYFRMHPGSQTRALLRTAQTAEDLRRTLDLNEQALPPEMVPQIMPRARAHHAGQMLRNAKAALDLALMPTAERYIREACAIYPDAAITPEFLECLKHPSLAKLRQQFREVAMRYGA
ncbi:MAG: glycosyltransferase [Roseomonas sp.]|nr:glycosyltransferase [Roseomonas sp.]MCA3320862.1 glycosyltransferase [Roseomonas sp.]